MLAGKKLIVGILSLIILITITGTAEARSVYVIADTGTELTDIPLIQAYDIVGSTLVSQTDYGSVHLTGRFGMPVADGYLYNLDAVAVPEAATLFLVGLGWLILRKRN